MRRPFAALAALLAAAALAACALPPGGVQSGAPGAPLTPVAFSQLPGWPESNPAAVLRAFVQSCAALAQLPPRQSVGGSGETATLAGEAGQWTRVCSDANALKVGDETAARAFFERDFQPYALGSGLVTGYCEPELRGSRRPTDEYQVPLLRLPPDLVRAQLGQFDPDLKGQSITGRVAGSTLVPYFDRREIEAGALDGQDLALLWLQSPIDAFFLQIQGSGRVILGDGEVARVTYAEGRELVLEALGAASGRLRDMAAQFFERNWIDAEPRRGKRGGAFCMGVSPKLHPYVLCNYTDTARDVMTVAH
ncbi:MAG: MltA domain-containing protein, partial [Acetobacteraceae bacterium]